MTGGFPIYGEESYRLMLSLTAFRDVERVDLNKAEEYLHDRPVVSFQQW